MAITRRPGTDKQVRHALANADTTLKDAQGSIDKALNLGVLKPEEVEIMDKAKQVLQDSRLRTEFPILSRIYEGMVAKVESGESLELSEPQTKALLDLVGDLSFAENDTLKQLHNLGIINQANWDTFVVPHRDDTNTQHTKIGNQAKYGLAAFANMSTPLAVTIGISSLIPGTMGLIGAVGTSMLLGHTVTNKVQGKISNAGRVAGATLGMNAVQGEEVSSELILLASRASGNNILNASSLKDGLTNEIALGQMLLDGLATSKRDLMPIERPFVELSGKYLDSLPAILEKLEGGASEKEIRSDLVSLRNSLFDSDTLMAITKNVVGGYVQSKPAYTATVLAQLKVAGAELKKGLESTNGTPNESHQHIAKMFALLIPRIAEEGHKMNASGLELLAKIDEGTPLSVKDLASFEKNVVGFAETSHKKALDSLSLNEKQVREQAELAFDVLYETVVPSFQEVKKTPVTKRVKLEKREDGGFDVKGTFRGGFLGLGQEGKFNLVISERGDIDIDSLKVDVGEPFVKSATKKALEDVREMLGDKSARVKSIKVDKKGTPPDTPYELSATVNGKKVDVKVSTLGLVDWSSIAV